MSLLMGIRPRKDRFDRFFVLHLMLILAVAITSAFFSFGSAFVMAQDGEVFPFRMEEVFVTARKIVEKIQDVPISVTAIDAEVIDDLGIKDLSDISKLTAGLVFDSELGRGSNRPVIRGQANILGSSGVSYFVDGVYITGSIDDYDLNDVGRVEVVKGPQSALYGRNTYSGAINIITQSPGDYVLRRFKADVASDDQYDISASVRGPLGESWAGGISIRHYEMGGAFTNAWDGKDIGEQETESISANLEYNGSESFHMRARVYYRHRDDGQPAIARTDADDNNCFFDTDSALYAGRGRYFCGEVPNRDINTNWSQQLPHAEDSDKDLNLSLRLDYHLDDQWSLVSISGYNDNEGVNLTDADYDPLSYHTVNFTSNGFPFAGFEDGPPFLYGWAPNPGFVDFTSATAVEIEDISQEIRFEYNGQRSKAILGSYYFNQDFGSRGIREYPDDAQAIAQAGFLAEQARMQALCDANFLCESIRPLGFPVLSPLRRNTNALNIENLALFGMLSVDLTESLTMTFEGRWQQEKINQVAVAQNLGESPSNITRANAKFDAFLPRVTLDWRVSDNNLLFLLFAEGTKPGGLNGAAAIEAELPSFEEEDVQSIELGSKNILADGRVLANFSLFYNQVSGYQLTQAVQGAGRSITATVNAGDADIKGFEAEIQAQPIDSLSLTLNYAYIDGEFTRGVDANQGVLNSVADNGAADCSIGDQFPDIDGCIPLYGSIVGNRIPRTAKHQVYADAVFRTSMGDGDWDWYVGANYNFESGKYSQVHNQASTGDTALVNARVGFVNDNWAIQAYGRNLTGEDAWLNVLRNLEPNFTRAFALSARRDTYYGISAIYSW